MEYSDGTRVIVGYQKQHRRYYEAGSEHDEAMCLLLSRHHDPGSIAGLGLTVRFQDGSGSASEDIGRAIGTCEHLRGLALYGSIDPTEINDSRSSFFSYLSNNRSIVDLDVLLIDLSDLDDMPVFEPFFEHNTNLRSIGASYLKSSTVIHSFVSSLLKSKMNRLARIHFGSSGLRDETAAELIHTLNKIGGLHNLLDLWLGGNMIGRESCAALRTMLQNPACQIVSLDLSCNHIDDECIPSLVNGFVACSTLESLNVSDQHLLTKVGWKMLFSKYLSNPRCSIQKIILEADRERNNFHFGAEALAESLGRINSLKYLDFVGHDISTPGWRKLSKCLRSPSSGLLELCLDRCNINDVGLSNLFSVLASNTVLQVLQLAFVYGITPSGWADAFRLLRNSQCALEDLTLSDCYIDDEGASMLAHLLSDHLRNVVHIGFWSESIITKAGWGAFAEVLRPTSTSKLKTLRLGLTLDDTFFDDEDVIRFVTALRGNTTLEVLDMSDVDLPHNSMGTLVNVLCDASSVASVYNSNHTFITFECTYSDNTVVPSELDSLLEINKDKDKAQVVRTKLLLYFFIRVDNTGRVFGQLETSLMPNVMEWIGRDCLGYSAMYELCRIVPELFTQVHDSIRMEYRQEMNGTQQAKRTRVT